MGFDEQLTQRVKALTDGEGWIWYQLAEGEDIQSVLNKFRTRYNLEPKAVVLGREYNGGDVPEGIRSESGTYKPPGNSIWVQ